MSTRTALISLLVLVIVMGAVWAGYTFYMSRKVAHAPATSQSAAAVSSLSSATSTPITFEVVTTQADQERGLGGRASIPDNYGMLFVFPQDGVYGFWMKDMLTSIDMVWLSKEGTIVSIDKSVPADSYPAVYYPAHPIRYVLETRAGFADKKGWEIGTKIDLPLPY